MAISVADNFSYNGAKPLDARVKYATVAAMVLVPDANLYNGIIAYVEENKRYYAYDSNNTVDPTTGKWRIFESGVVQNYAILDNKPSINNVILSGNKNSDVLGLQDTIQVAEMPTAGIDYAGKIFQYIGVTSNSYDHGYFYECVENGGVYSWENVNVQDGGGSGGGGGHTIQDNGTDKTDRSNLNFVDFDIADDSTNDATNVEVHRITSAELAEIFSSGLPGAISAVDYGGVTNDANIFSTDEKVIGQWIDGKPLYQKTIDLGTITSKEYSTGVGTIDKVVSIEGFLVNSSGYEYFLQIPKPNDTIYYQYKGDGDTLIVTCAGSWSSYTNCYITIRYTKTTDSAVSSGEKIVGQTSGGAVIYEKTFNVGHTYPIDYDLPSDVDQVLNFYAYIEDYGNIPHIASDANWCIWIYVSEGVISVRRGNNIGPYAPGDVIVTVRYTKV